MNLRNDGIDFLKYVLDTLGKMGYPEPDFVEIHKHFDNIRSPSVSLLWRLITDYADIQLNVWYSGFCTIRQLNPIDSRVLSHFVFDTSEIPLPP